METPELLPEHVPDDNYVYVDGWTSGNPGPGGFQVVDGLGHVLFSKNYTDLHSNNWYELGGIATAAIKCPGKVIWTDSVTAIAWANGRMGKTAKARYIGDEPLHKMVEAIEWAKPIIKKWNTELWGEIPADFGRK